MRRAATLAIALPAALGAAWLALPDAVPSFRIVPGRLTVRARWGGLVQHTDGLLLEARDWRGRISFDPLRPTTARVSVSVSVRSLEPVSPRLEEQERNLVLAYAFAPDLLDAGRWPEIAFVGSGLRAGGERGSGFFAVSVPGRVEVRGRAMAATLDAIARVTTAGLEVYGRHFIRASDHGIRFVAAPDRLPGPGAIRDELEVEFRLLAVPETSLELREDEARPPELRERTRRSGEPLREAPAPKTRSGEWRDPKGG